MKYCVPYLPTKGAVLIANTFFVLVGHFVATKGMVIKPAIAHSEEVVANFFNQCPIQVAGLEDVLQVSFTPGIGAL